MTLDVQFDFRDFERAAREMGAAIDQVPFALANSLNEAAFKVRDHFITQTWPRSVTVRKPAFMRAALRVTKKATKRDLSVEVGDVLGRAHLKLHAAGGVKRARGRLAIPTANVSRGASGVTRSQRPGVLRGKVVKGNRIFQAVGRGRSKKLRLMYVLASSATIKKDVPFYADFRRVMTQEVARAFPQAMVRAMRSRR